MNGAGGIVAAPAQLGIGVMATERDRFGSDLRVKQIDSDRLPRRATWQKMKI